MKPRGQDGNVSDRVVLADREHRYRAALWIIFRALAKDHAAWWPLHPGEVLPAVVDAAPPDRIVWSSPWPVSPNDTIEFSLTIWGHDGTALRFRWLTDAPPDDRGVAITRQRLNTKLGGFLRGWLTDDRAWRPADE